MIVPFEEEQAREILEPKNLAQLCGLPVGDLPLGRALDLGVLPTLGAFLSRAGPAAPTFCRDYLRDWLQKNKAAQLEFVAGTAEGLGQESSSQTAWELIRVLADPSLPALKNPRDALSEAAALLKNSNENMALELVRDRVNLLRQPRPESAAHDLSWLVTDVDYGRVVSSLSVPEEAPSVPGVEARLLIAGRPPLSRAVRLVQRGDATEVVWGVSPVPGSANPLEIRFETRLAGTAQLLRTLRGTAAPTLPGPPAHRRTTRTRTAA
ncbi:MAG TPA: hypothetical protein PKY30_12765, partial [Myxococcota bacterium]|nr:hypothetical protein [Myxococcota bacterium]